VRKKGGSSKLLLGGLGAAAAGGAVLALRKKDEGGCDTVFASRSGPLTRPVDVQVDLVGGPALEAGLWYAELTWTGGPPAETDVILRIFDAAGTHILDGTLQGNARKKAEWNGQPGTTYMARAILVAGGPVSFELSIGGPCIN
jgi:hypothetical protein